MSIETTLESLRALAKVSVNRREPFAPDFSEPSRVAVALATELEDAGFQGLWFLQRGYRVGTESRPGFSFPFRRGGPDGTLAVALCFSLRNGWRWDVTCWGREPVLVETARDILVGCSLLDTFQIALPPDWY